MTKIAIRNADLAIGRRESFESHGALSGEAFAGTVAYLYAGRMPERWSIAVAEAAERHGGIVYVVRSYWTPIAVVFADGTRVLPDVKYSVTTSKHQGVVRRAWAGEYATTISELQGARVRETEAVHVTRRGGIDRFDRRVLGEIVELWTGARAVIEVGARTPARGVTLVLPDTPQARAALISPKLTSYHFTREA